MISTLRGRDAVPGDAAAAPTRPSEPRSGRPASFRPELAKPQFAFDPRLRERSGLPLELTDRVVALDPREMPKGYETFRMKRDREHAEGEEFHGTTLLTNLRKLLAVPLSALAEF